MACKSAKTSQFLLLALEISEDELNSDLELNCDKEDIQSFSSVFVIKNQVINVTGNNNFGIAKEMLSEKGCLSLIKL